MFQMRAPMLARATAGGGGGGGISFVGSFAFADNASGTFNFSSLQDTGGGTPSVLTDDLVIAIFGSGSNSDRPESTLKPDTATYTSAFTDLYSDDIADANLLVSYKFMGGTPDTSFTYPAISGTGSSRAIAVFVLRGVNTSTPLDVTPTTATGIDTGAANPPSITPATAGAWIMVAGVYGENGDLIAFTNPGDLSSTTNHYRSQLGPDSTRDCGLAVGLKTDWASGAFDPSTFTGGSTSVDAAWAAASVAFRPA